MNFRRKERKEIMKIDDVSGQERKVELPGLSETNIEVHNDLR